MRITNKIIQNNSLNNINTNKNLQDKLSTMISSEKKISRPSDDPIVALRSLRLRTSVTQTSQYLEKNAADAESWLKVTEDSINTLSDIISDIRKQYVKGSSDTLTPSDRAIIVEDLKALAAEVYNTGNADFAGRSVFTGYRTESSLTFKADERTEYTITEDESSLRIDTTNYVDQGPVEENVKAYDITRIRLSYNALEDADVTFSLNGTDTTATKMSVSADPNPYKTVATDPDAVVFVPETGEILLGANVAADPESIANATVTYKKNTWEKGELRPEHYFNCVDNTNDIEYLSHGGEIEYNIGVNQSLRVNTTADECFNHDIVRDLQDVIASIEDLTDIENEIADLEKELEGLSDTQVAEKAAVQKKIDAAKKSQTYLKEKTHQLFESGITKADGYLNRNNVALTNCGTRSKRLELIENRLSTQLSTLKELKSDNEDADIAETAVKLSSAQYAYDAALMSTAKILQENLLNYI